MGFQILEAVGGLVFGHCHIDFVTKASSGLPLFVVRGLLGVRKECALRVVAP